jgi:protein-tyrosine phosphatase
MNEPIISDDGTVVWAPRPARLADEVHPNLWVGGAWATYTERFDAVYDRRTTGDGPYIPGDLDDVAGRVLEDLAAGRKVLLYCHLGLNRSALVAAVVLRRLRPDWHGLTGVSHMRRVRSHHVLCNPAYARHIRELT